MTPDELKRLFPNASASTLARNAGAAGLHPAESKRAEGRSLERREAGARPGVVGVVRRALVIIRVFSVRPADADNHHIKGIIDGLVHAGLLDGDAWHQVAVLKISHKVHSKEQERTEIKIEYEREL